MTAKQTWLIDKSAYARLDETGDAQLWASRIEHGLVHICTVTRLEIGYSFPSAAEAERLLRGLLSFLVPVYATPAVEHRAIDIQMKLLRHGHHRAPSVPDLIVAATAEALGHTLLHVDKDFALIAEITGQPIEYLRLAAD
ncbi:MAG: PIN domain nuclease [Propionibacteriaceae bacterium]|nr:PIN domain nuclease [Propionibacteriaceae bacterium]